MPRYEITTPDGRRFEITAPEGATQEQVMAYAQQQYGQQPAEPPQRPNLADETRRYQREAQDKLLKSMPWQDKLAAGAGRSVAETWRGLKQVGGAIADQIPGVDLTDFRRRTQEEIDAARGPDDDLLGTGWGATGNVAGVIAQLVTPGVALKGTGLARAILPATIRGNALQGAVIGGLQPTATGESRGFNILAGGAGGAAGAGAIRAGSALTGAARNALAGTGRVSSVDRAAAERLLAEAEDAASLSRSAPSAIPGVQRTLAEESRDAGVARLEQTLRGQPGFNWGARDSANNIARTNALEQIAGSDADMAAAVAGREQASSGALQRAMAANPVDVSNTLQALDDAIANTRGRSAVQPALIGLRNRLAEYRNSGGRIDMQTLDNVRQDIGDMLGGRFGGDGGAALKGARELIGVRDALHGEVGAQVPAYADFLNAYRQGSAPINRMETGREILRRSTQNVQTDAAGNRLLAPKPLANAVANLDAIAARATGFPKARAANFMPPDMIATLKALQDDMERQVLARTAGTGGNSASAARAGVLSRLGSRAGNTVAAVVPYGQTVKSLLQTLDEKGQQRITERLAYLVANPEDARRVLAALPPAGRKIVSKALAEASGALAAGVGVSEATQDAPLQLDIIGGTPGAAPSEEELARLRAEAEARASRTTVY